MLALPVNAPTKLVDVTLVKPAKVVDVAPSAVDVEPIVIVLFVKLALGIADNVLVLPLIDLLVSVSVVAFPTNVSVAAGRVKVVVPAVAVARTVVVPDVEPLNLTPVPPNVGQVANTAAPVPVSSVKAASNWAEVKEPNTAAFPTDVI